ncbi:ice-binding family protein [uncultured Albimonas sp.]|uniref:ice-binding family protein n=1 Tax=uncultured Albimonas sp. TaxID=1331701 RepID=UPI0030EF0F59
MFRFPTRVAALPIAAALIGTPVFALALPILGDDLSSFAVLGASTVTNVPTSVVQGNVGVGIGPAVTGFTAVAGAAVADVQVTDGLVHSTTPTAQSAQSQLSIARGYLASLGIGAMLGADLAGLTLAPGVYTVAAGVTNLSGTLILDGGGNANAAWVFHMPSTLITSSDAVVSIVGAGPGAGLFWNVGSSATLGSGTEFLGNILASASITAATGATNLCGRLLAETEAVTLEQNSLSIGCDGALAESGGLGGGLDVVDGGEVVFRAYAPLTAAVPLPAGILLLVSGFAALIAARGRRPAA